MNAAPADYITTMPKDEQNDRRKIRTFTGRYVNPLAMTPDDIDIRDVAHHLSLICRYTGACPTHYSVGQHSVLATVAAISESRHMIPRDAALFQLAHLLHDAGEYVFNDIASPVKRDPRMAWYCAAEHDLTLMIFDKFGVPRELMAQTKPLDDEMFHREALSWWGGVQVVRPWAPEFTEERFLYRFKLLMKRVHG